MKGEIANGELIAEKNAENAALREALDGVRWLTDDVSYLTRCSECRAVKSWSEHHAPDCKIGRLFAKEESQSVEAEAYNAFLQVILGTVYGRVDK